MDIFSGFLDTQECWTAIRKKLDDLKTSTKIGEDFETIIDNKKVKFFLPSDVRKQFKMLTMAQEIYQLAVGNEVNKRIDLEIAFCEMVIAHTLVDDQERDINTLTLPDIKTYSFMYFLEMLLPLFQRSSTRVDDAIKATLKKYLNTSETN